MGSNPETESHASVSEHLAGIAEPPDVTDLG